MIAKNIITNDLFQNTTISEEKERKWLWLLLPLISFFCNGVNWVCTAFFGILLFLLMLILFFYRLGKTIPILEYTLWIAGLFWIVAPLYVYFRPMSVHYNTMVCPREYYFTLTVPAYACYIAGMMTIAKPIKFEKTSKSENSLKILPFLLCLAIGGSIIHLFSYQSFVITLLWTLLIPIILVASFYKCTKTLIFSFSLLMIPFVKSIMAWGQIRELLFFLEYLLMYLALMLKINWKIKLFIPIVAIVFLFTMQYHKAYVRNELDDKNVSGVYVGDKIYYDDAKEGLAGVINNTMAFRLNQGWIISHVYRHIDSYNLHYGWEPIGDLIVAMLFPRFLVPDKIMSGGHEQMFNYAGYKTDKHTAMNVSVIGEGYACFGRYGMCIYVFCWGLLFSLAINFMLFCEKLTGFGFFFIPYVFFRVSSPECDTLMPANYFVKAIIFLAAIIFVWNSFNNRKNHYKNNCYTLKTLKNSSNKL